MQKRCPTLADLKKSFAAGTDNLRNCWLILCALSEFNWESFFSVLKKLLYLSKWICSALWVSQPSPNTKTESFWISFGYYWRKFNYFTVCTIRWIDPSWHYCVNKDAHLVKCMPNRIPHLQSRAWQCLTASGDYAWQRHQTAYVLSFYCSPSRRYITIGYSALR